MEFFVEMYRPYLRSAAVVILRASAASAEARELADSLFAELYGLADGKNGRAVAVPLFSRAKFVEDVAAGCAGAAAH